MKKVDCIFAECDFPPLKIYSIVKEERRQRVPLSFERPVPGTDSALGRDLGRTVRRRGMDLIMARRAIYGKPEDASGK